MGNRAIITTAPEKGAPAIYLHWNGGRDSVEGFLMAANHMHLYSITDDRERMDAFGKLIAEHFFNSEYGKMNVYPHTMHSWHDDAGDHGIYVIDSDFHIVGRLFAPRTEQNAYSSMDIFHAIMEHIAAEEVSA